MLCGGTVNNLLASGVPLCFETDGAQPWSRRRQLCLTVPPPLLLQADPDGHPQDNPCESQTSARLASALKTIPLHALSRTTLVLPCDTAQLPSVAAGCKRATARATQPAAWLARLAAGGSSEAVSSEVVLNPTRAAPCPSVAWPRARRRCLSCRRWRARCSLSPSSSGVHGRH